MKVVLFTFMLSFFYPATVSAQESNVRYTISDGLPSQEIYDLHQDHNGLIWIATDRGIASFNGSYFNNYDIIDGLPNRVVFEFFPQDDGTLWCTTKTNELFYFHPDTLHFHMYPHNDKLREMHDSIGKGEQRALVVNPDGSIKFRFLWKPGIVIISQSGVLEFDFEGWNARKKRTKTYCRIGRDKKGYLHHQLADSLDEKALPYRNRNHLIDLGEGKVMNVHASGYSLLNSAMDVEYAVEYDGLQSLNSGGCREGFWIGYVNHGLTIFDKNLDTLKRLAQDYSCTSYLKDKDGGVWVGTHGAGLLYYSGFKVKTIPESRNKSIHYLTVNGNNQLVFGTNEGVLHEAQINGRVVNSQKHNWTKHTSQYYFNDGQYYNMGTLEIDGYVAAISRYSDARNKSPLFICGSRIMTTKGRELFQSTKNQIEDAEWFGDKIVACNQGEVLLIKNKEVINAFKTSIKANDLDVHKGVVYVATSGKGLMIFDRHLNHVKSITTKSGLLSNYINEVLIDGNNIWLGTSNGLSKVDLSLAASPIETLTRDEGLVDNEVTDIEIVDNVLFASTREGVSFFQESDWAEVLREKTKIYFKRTKLLVNGADIIDFSDLSHSENQLEVRFELISFANIRGLKFRYKVEGLDKEWNITSERKITYQSVPPGEYSLIIQPLINGVPRGSIIQESILISPAFYNTWWFALSIVVFTAFVIWLFFKYRILAYNRDVIREILRYLLRKVQPKSDDFVVRSNGNDVKIFSNQVTYVESDKNYIVIHTLNDKVIIREKISNFKNLVPDPIEYLQIRRSIIVRIDKISAKSVNSITVNNTEIRVGKTYLKELAKIKL